MRAERIRVRRGAILIEVLIAMVILATAGTALITALGQTRETMRSVRAMERQLDSASRELDRLVLLDGPALAAREGWTQRGPWAIQVAPLSPVLFDVSVAASFSSRPLLSTTIYRRDTTRAQ